MKICEYQKCKLHLKPVTCESYNPKPLRVHIPLPDNEFLHYVFADVLALLHDVTFTPSLFLSVFVSLFSISFIR